MEKKRVQRRIDTGADWVKGDSYQKEDIKVSRTGLRHTVGGIKRTLHQGGAITRYRQKAYIGKKEGGRNSLRDEIVATRMSKEHEELQKLQPETADHFHNTFPRPHGVSSKIAQLNQ
eukprot:746042-Hanusia_phi.AAC.3